MTENEKNRYNRQIILPGIGEKGQQKLKDARVLIVGCGGLGSPVLQYLTAAGVGTLGIIDPDVVSESNLQRQILYSTTDIGSSKTEIAKQRLNALNPLVQIDTYPIAFDTTNAIDILSKYDFAIDCTDNFATRYVLNDACVALHKPMIYGSVYQFEGQVSVMNYNNGVTYRDLFPEPPANMPPAATIGVIGVVPGIIGVMQANEAIKLITGVGNLLSNKLVTYYALEASFRTFNL